MLTAGKRWANNQRMPLEIKRLHLASLRGVDGCRWPVHGFAGTHDGGQLLAGQASDAPAWPDSLRRIHSLGPDRVHFCHHAGVIHR